jgi:hypothetical protein
MKHFAGPALALLALGGCVSVFEGTSQEIAVNTTPPEASCAFEREGQSIGVLPKTPGKLTVRKSKYDITIRCDKPGYEQATYINHSGVSATIAANIVVDVLLTAGISSIVDSANGADNKYDGVVNIMMVPVVASAVAPAAPSAATAPENNVVSTNPMTATTPTTPSQ